MLRLWSRRKAPKSLGKRGEDWAAQHLRRQGLRILDRNRQAGRYEIDIIAKEGETIVFVEVKTRRPSPIASPEANITRTKRKHLRTAAKAYIAAHDQPGCYYRFDLVAIIVPLEGSPEIRHYRHAFGIND